MKSLKNLKLDHADWAVAAPISFDEMVRIPIATKNEWDIVGTPDGFSVLFVVGSFEAERMARNLATTTRTAYSLDFHDEAPRVIEFSANGDTEYLEEHPATFLEERGVIAPGYEPSSRPLPTKVILVEGVSPTRVRELLQRDELEVVSHSRGSLILPGRYGVETRELSQATNQRVLTVYFNADDGSYWVWLYSAGTGPLVFESQPTVLLRDVPHVASIDGATSLDDICRVLDIAPHYLGI